MNIAFVPKIVDFDIKAAELSKRITIEVVIKFSGLKWWRFRVWIAVKLIKLATFIAGFNLKVDTSSTQVQV